MIPGYGNLKSAFNLLRLIHIIQTLDFSDVNTSKLIFVTTAKEILLKTSHKIRKILSCPKMVSSMIFFKKIMSVTGY